MGKRLLILYSHALLLLGVILSVGWFENGVHGFGGPATFGGVTVVRRSKGRVSSSTALSSQEEEHHRRGPSRPEPPMDYMSRMESIADARIEKDEADLSGYGFSSGGVLEHETESEKDIKRRLIEEDTMIQRAKIEDALTRHYSKEEGEPKDPLHKSGISVKDILDDSQVDEFETKLIPVYPGVAQITTKSRNFAAITAYDPIRYLISLSPPNTNGSVTQPECYVLVDCPPYTDQLAQDIRDFMANPDSKLVAMVTTSRDAIHYGKPKAMYVERRSDLLQWTKAFPEMQIVTYRIDTPRDCRPMVTELLDGEGPWALKEYRRNETDAMPIAVRMVETGRPMQRIEVTDENNDIVERIMAGEDIKPQDDGLAHLYTPEAIRKREDQYRMLALYTPGHSRGTISYIFPSQRILASGFTIPLEEFGEDIENDRDMGPALDVRGYIGTSRHFPLQMESARKLVELYVDRFDIVLAGRREEPLDLRFQRNERIRKKLLMKLIDAYDKIGKVYHRLGIFEDEDEEEEEENDDEAYGSGVDSLEEYTNRNEQPVHEDKIPKKDGTKHDLSKLNP